MALTITPFFGTSPTVINTVGGAAGATTMTFATTAVHGYPSARITNSGTANAFIQFITSANTVTVGVTNSQPVLASASVVLATGGMQAMAFNAASTFTTTIFVTPGQGGTSR